MNYFLYIFLIILTITIFIFGQRRGISMLNTLDEEMRDEEEKRLEEAEKKNL